MREPSQMRVNLGKMIIFLCFLFYSVLFVSGKAEAAKNSSPYQLRVNRIYNTVTVYAKDSKGEYTKPVRVMLCSVGVNLEQTTGFTPTGSYNTSAKYRWRALFGDVYGQYATRITGNILFHSVYYLEDKKPDTLNAEEFNKLGERASKGCIRLNCADAKWIYDNCPIGTNVVIYDDELSPGPLGVPEAIKIPEDAIWDPTDPSPNNPYKKLVPTIKGAKNKVITAGEPFNPLEGVTAYSTVGIDISEKLIVNGKVNENLPGDYKIQYVIVDGLGRMKKKNVVITVDDTEITPQIEIEGDKIIPVGKKINNSFLLKGVKAYFGTRQYNRNEIDVDLVQISDLSYLVTYHVVGDNGIETTAQSNIYIDNEAPRFYGLEDEINIPADLVITKDVALSFISVVDDYSVITEDNITVKIEELTDYKTLLIYQAEDEVGNHSTKMLTLNKK